MASHDTIRIYHFYRTASEHSQQICFCSLTLKNKSLCLSVDGFHSLCHCSHIGLCKCVLLNEVLDTCQVLPIVLRLQRDLGAEERVREKRKRVEEEGQVERRDETEVGGEGGE